MTSRGTYIVSVTLFTSTMKYVIVTQDIYWLPGEDISVQDHLVSCVH